LENKKKLLSCALLFCIILSLSTSAYVAFPLALLLYSFFRRKVGATLVLAVLAFVAVFIVLYVVYPQTFEQLFTAKISGDNDSGQTRHDAGISIRETMASFSLMNRVFGIGFGYYYGGVFYNVLVNTGWMGLLVYLYAFLKPVFLLRSEEGKVALKVALGILFFLFYISVSELFLPTTWMFLGLAYWRLDQQKYRESLSGEPARPDRSRALVSA
jgi:hypothetical protein